MNRFSKTLVALLLLTTTVAAQYNLESILGRYGVSVRPSSAISTLPFTDDFEDTLDAEWETYRSGSGSDPAITTDEVHQGSQAVEFDSSSTSYVARAWRSDITATNAEVSAAVYLGGLQRSEVIVRGSNLDGATPTYYSVDIQRNLTVRFYKTVAGTKTGLADSITSTDYLSGAWVTVRVYANNDNIRGMVYRQSTGRYLDSDGDWVLTPTYCFNVTDSSISSSGFVGVGRVTGTVGSTYCDDFFVRSVDADSTPPSVLVTTPTEGATVANEIPVAATASDDQGVQRVDFEVDGVLRSSDTQAPFGYDLDTLGLTNGSHEVAATAYDFAENTASDSVNVTVANTLTLYHPTLPGKNNYVPVLMLLYSGLPDTSIGAAQEAIFDEFVDMAVINERYYDDMDMANMGSHCGVYTNFSNIYLGLLNSWHTYASENGLDEEDAFYHVSQAGLTYNGGGGSTVRCDKFARVWHDGEEYSFITYGEFDTGFNVTEPVYFGQNIRFREFNLVLTTPSSGAYAGVWEYPSAKDENGNPTTWSTLPVVSSEIGSLSSDGQMLLDIPADWVRCYVNGYHNWYIRFRPTNTGGTQPEIYTAKSEDYNQSGDGYNGSFPLYDWDSDTEGKGFLTPAQHAGRAAGHDAWIAAHSRYTANYGEQRYIVRPTPAVRDWLVAEHIGYMASWETWENFFLLDNSSGKFAELDLNLEKIREGSAATHGSDYAALVQYIGNEAMHDDDRYICANIGPEHEARLVQARNVVSFNEFALRPRGTHYQSFITHWNEINARNKLTSPQPYQVIDTHPQYGSLSDDRMMIGGMCMYLLIHFPDNGTIFCPWGGYDPDGDTVDHWCGFYSWAVDNVGEPLEQWSIREDGTDPEDAGKTFKLLQRPFENCIVLWKSPSHDGGSTFGNYTAAAETTHTLGGSFQPVDIDGNLGTPITSITLRNGEGAILVPAP